MERFPGDDEASRPFAQRGEVAAGVAIPRWLVAGVALAAAIGIGEARLVTDTRPKFLAACVFFGALWPYLFLALVDFAEHYRLERLASRRWISFTVVPLGETINHAATVALLSAFLMLGRPLPATLAPRDWLVLAAPALFLALGWRDEVVYHRRRTSHREDLLHTTSHLAAGVMMAGFLLYRVAR